MRAFLFPIVFLTVCCGVVFADPHTNLNQSSTTTQVYLDTHNLVRSGYNAQPLTWSAHLASKAQEWASACNFKHTEGHLGPYGENIAAGTGNFTAQDAMAMFMDGLATFDPSNPTFSDFTQVVWQSTTELGCASAQCDSIFDASFGEATLYVCLYQPVGNVVGELSHNIGVF